jgi:hypothetical protein
MNVGDLRRFIAGSQDSRAVDVIVLGAGVQSNVSLQSSVPNLKIVVRVQGEAQQAQVIAPDDASEPAAQVKKESQKDVADRPR